MLRTYRDRGIILRTYKLGEADRIVIILGKENGIIRAVAKGVRRPTSRFGGSLEPFNVADLQLHRGRNLDTVTQVQLHAGYAGQLGADYEAFTAAKVLVETVQKLVQDVPEADASVFTLLHGALGALAGRRYDPDLIVSSFLLRLMRSAGWDPVLDDCASCGALGPHRAFSAESGGVVCASCIGTARIDCGQGTLALVGALITPNWEAVTGYTGHERALARQLSGVWAQYHLEQRLRSLPFLPSAEEPHELY